MMNANENLYAQATMENFRKLPLRLQRQVLEALRAEVTSEETVAPSFRRVPVVDRTAEFRWIAAHRNEYAGQWVALHGNQLLAHHTDYREVSQAVKTQGATQVMFMYLES
jgi:hypothetical protein